MEDLRRALVDALRRGHVDFVELLIEFGTSLENLTIGDLRRLYETQTVGCESFSASTDELTTPLL